jgi:hypothetical protein
VSEIKLALIIIGAAVIVTVLGAMGVCVWIRPDFTKEIIIAAIALVGSLVSGMLGWLAHDLIGTKEEPELTEAKQALSTALKVENETTHS